MLNGFFLRLCELYARCGDNLLNEIQERKLQEKSLLHRAQEANSHVPVP
jgi:hypothetical protein